MELIIDQFTSVDLDAVVRLTLALVLGAIVGFERETAGKSAGVRTYGLVALGAALFTYLSLVGFPAAEGNIVDPARIAAQVVVGIGFFGRRYYYLSRRSCARANHCRRPLDGGGNWHVYGRRASWPCGCSNHFGDCCVSPVAHF